MSRGPESEQGALPVPGVSRRERRSWLVQRVGWVLMALVIAMAATGALGGDGISETAARAGTLEVRYQRVMRVNAPTALEWRVTPASDSLIAIELDPAFGGVLDIQSVFPEPVLSELSDSGIRFLFRAAGSRPVAVHVSVEPGRVGRYALRTRAGAGTWLLLPVLILP